MSVLTDNNISVKDYNEISKYKDLKIKIEKIWHLKTTTLPITIGVLSMIKKSTDKHIKIHDSPSLNEIKTLHFL